MSGHRIRGIATLVGVSALVLAGPTAAAVADSDLQTFGGQPSQEQGPGQGEQQWSLDRSRGPEETDGRQGSRLGSLDEDDTTDGDASSDANTASGPGEDFCDAAFADNEDAHAQCTEVASTLAPEDEGDGGEDDTGEDDGTEGEDDSTGEDGQQENPFQQFCDEAFADDEDAHAQCTEVAGNFEQDEGGEGEDPFQQFCDEAFADNEDAHTQCTEFAQALAGEEEDGGDEDDTTDEDGDTADDEEDPADDQDQSGTLDESQTASPAADDGALPVTGLNVAVAGLSSLSLLGLGGALLRRFRADSLG